MFTWNDLAKYLIESGVDTEIDLEYSVIICPECGEPIDKEDYPIIDSEIPVCPICGCVL